ncbi:M48 family metallopeptidase [Massilia niastensis]|uniref:M48 family metallopeptidase n=1 Tax=Massilia niastensis TaxID=544911 RepID=UPI00036F8001|nr:M48 family metallopeptidase [Massilia niastensis]
MASAHYFDGRSARLHAVDLQLADGQLLLRGAVEKAYPFAAATLAEPFAHAPAVLHFDDGARCEVPDPAGFAPLAAALGYRKPRVVRWQERTFASLTCLALLVLFLAASYFVGIPAATGLIADALPRQVDQSLGAGTLAALEKQRLLLPSRFSDERVADIQAIMRRVSSSDSDLPLRLLVRSAPRLGPNALALPDGTVVVTDELVRAIIDRREGFDEAATAQLSGVLAHEIGHVRMRHSVHSLTRTSLTAALSAFLFGDFSAVAAGAPALLLNMHYSRDMELEADGYAIARLREHGMSPGHLADLFEDLDAGEEAHAGWAGRASDYISTHPAGAERAARLREAAKAE